MSRVALLLAASSLLATLVFLLFLAGWEMSWSSEDVVLGVLLCLPLQAAITALLFFRHNRRLASPAGWGRLLLGNLLLLLVLLTSALAAGEVYFRFFYDTTDSIAYTKVTKRWIERHYHLNKVKLRDNIEYSPAIAPGHRRVSFLGDSFTAGHGIEDVEDRFSNRLRRLHPDWEVHVLAEKGVDTGAELEFFAGLTASGYQADQVVLVYCLNDVNDLLPEWMRAQASITDRVSQRIPLFDHSYLFDIAYYRLSIAKVPWVKDYFSFVREAYRGAKWEEQKQRLRALRKLVERRGGRLSVVIFPFLHALGPDYEYRFVHDQLNAFWREENVPHLDLLPVFEGYPPARLTVNPFDAHPNQLANRLAAERIEAFLIEQLKARRTR